MENTRDNGNIVTEHQDPQDMMMDNNAGSPSPKQGT